MTMRNLAVMILSCMLVFILVNIDYAALLLWCNQSQPICTCKIIFQSSGRTFTLNESAAGDIILSTQPGPSWVGASAKSECSRQHLPCPAPLSATGQDVDIKHRIIMERASSAMLRVALEQQQS